MLTRNINIEPQGYRSLVERAITQFVALHIKHRVDSHSMPKRNRGMLLILLCSEFFHSCKFLPFFSIVDVHIVSWKPIRIQCIAQQSAQVTAGRFLTIKSNCAAFSSRIAPTNIMIDVHLWLQTCSRMWCFPKPLGIPCYDIILHSR